EDHFENEALGCSPRGQRRPQVNVIWKEVPEQGARQKGTDQLGPDVTRDPTPGETSGGGKCSCHGRIQMGAADVTECVDHRQDNQTEGDGDPGMGNGAVTCLKIGKGS